jgi:Icc protein
MGPSTRTVVFVHHPPIAINVDWLDKLGLDEAADLVEVLEASPQVKVICAGHVHQEFASRIGAAAIFTTPSTCVQFGARSDRSFDTRAAGYRTLRLDDGYHTEVHRLGEQREG